MADTTKIGNVAAAAEADAFASLLDNGYLRIYDSTGGTGGALAGTGATGGTGVTGIVYQLALS